MREADAAMGVAHYWLSDPIVEQGSMNGRFASVLDRKRIGRSRAWTGLRFRWDRWWRRTIEARSEATSFVEPASLTASELSRDRWALAIARIAAALVAIGAFTGAAVANIAAVVMLLAFIAAPSCVRRVQVGMASAAGQGEHRVPGRSCCYRSRGAQAPLFDGAESMDRVAPLSVAVHRACDFRHALFKARVRVRSSSSPRARRRSPLSSSLTSGRRKRRPMWQAESFCAITLRKAWR